MTDAMREADDIRAGGRGTDGSRDWRGAPRFQRVLLPEPHCDFCGATATWLLVDRAACLSSVPACDRCATEMLRDG